MRYRLETPHYINDVYCAAGTEIGDGTAVMFDGIPSRFMVPLDHEAEEAVAKMKEWREARASGVHVAEAQKAILEAARDSIPDTIKSGGAITPHRDVPGNVPGQAPRFPSGKK